MLVVTLAETGGAQKYVQALATHLPKEDFEVKVVCGGASGPLVQLLQIQGIEVITLPSLVREIDPRKDWQACRQLIKLIQDWQPHIVHTNSSKTGLLGRIAARACRVPVSIYTAHGFVLSERLSLPNKAFYWLAEKLGAALGTHTIAVSEADRRLALRYHLTRSPKITTIYNGIETPVFTGNVAELRAELELPADSLIVGTIANFYVNKGLRYFIEACAEVKQSVPNAHFVIIGDGEQRAELTRLIAQLELSDSITLLGRRSDAARLCRVFDVFVLPSIKEGLPFALLEAMAQTRPVVATRVGGVAEVLGDGKFGLIVKPADPEALASAISHLLKNPALATALGETARQHVLNHFSLEQMVEATVATYQTALIPEIQATNFS